MRCDRLISETRRRGGEREVVGGFASGGDDDGLDGAGRAVGEEGGVVAGVAVRRDGQPAGAGVAAGGEGDAFLEAEATGREGLGSRWCGCR